MMKKRKIVSALLFVAAVAVASLSFAGCASDVEDADNGTVEAQESYFTESDVQGAVNRVSSSYASGPIVGLSVSVDTGSRVVYLDVIAATDDVKIAEEAVEDVIRAVSVETAYCALSEADGRGDEQAIAAIESFVDSDDAYASGLGRLFETYGLNIHADNPDGTLALDGMRKAGEAGSVNWQ